MLAPAAIHRIPIEDDLAPTSMSTATTLRGDVQVLDPTLTPVATHDVSNPLVGQDRGRGTVGRKVAVPTRRSLSRMTSGRASGEHARYQGSDARAREEVDRNAGPLQSPQHLDVRETSHAAGPQRQPHLQPPRCHGLSSPRSGWLDRFPTRPWPRWTPARFSGGRHLTHASPHTWPCGPVPSDDSQSQPARSSTEVLTEVRGAADWTGPAAPEEGNPQRTRAKEAWRDSIELSDVGPRMRSEENEADGDAGDWRRQSP